MKYLNGKYYVEVKDKGYNIHPTENNILGFREEPKSLGTQNHVQNDTQTRKNQRVIKINNNELVVKNYTKNKKQPIIQQSRINFLSRPNCKRNSCFEFDKGW